MNVNVRVRVRLCMTCSWHYFRYLMKNESATLRGVPTTIFEMTSLL
jgi:hypothetical protein